MEVLKSKHPKAQPANCDSVLNGPKNEVEDIIFDNIDDTMIYNCGKEIQGSGGPSGLNADGIKRILCSKSFKSSSTDLCYSVALIARRLCTERIDPVCLEAYNASKLIPLAKKPEGIRPIGIGEVIK